MRLSSFLALALLASFSVVGRADDAAPSSPDEIKKELALKQETLARQYRAFEQSLLRLAQRLEKSDKEEDRARAVQLKKALELGAKEDVRGKFDALILTLHNTKSLNLPEIKDAMTQQKMLATDIRAILALLLDNDRLKELNDQILSIKKIIKELDRNIRDQKVVRTNTEGEKVERDSLAKLQIKVATHTQNVARLMGAPMDKRNEPNVGNAQQYPQLRGYQQVQQANTSQNQAVTKIQQGQNAAASNDQDQSIQKLEDARKQLEEILRQLRQEEIERVLAALQARCERMLQMQLAVYAGTVEIDTTTANRPDKKPSRVDEQRAIGLSVTEDQIVAEAVKTIQLLETEGTAVAFHEVFSQLRDDMKHVSRRLGKVDTGTVTQVIERDIIATLREMVDALKKAADVAANPTPPPPPTDNTNKPGARTLVTQLAELKMIRAMQVRVNTRTSTYGDRYKGEQANLPEIQTELKNLSERQKRIAEITTAHDKEKNK